MSFASGAVAWHVKYWRAALTGLELSAEVEERQFLVLPNEQHQAIQRLAAHA